MQKLNNDIYDITDTVKELQKTYIEEETEDILAVGIYGYLADINSLQIQNSIVVAGELGNELFPARAKFPKNVIAHAIIQNITDINAVPAKMDIILGIEEEKLNNLFVDDVFTIDKECPINIEYYEYHLEYDLIISRAKIVNNEYVYTARYDIGRKNALSDITNPYLPAPFMQSINKNKYVYFYCRLMQVEHNTQYKKIISSSTIENKTFEFEFENQLADFYLYVEDRDDKKYLTPIFEGMGVDNNLVDYCYFIYLDEHHIRVRFDALSYMPSVNANITVYIKTTQGKSGNFEYDRPFYTNISSNKFNYQNVTLQITPSSNSQDGLDMKSIEELRALLPKEALSRGSITNEQDLRNYFNMFNQNSSMQIQKKVDNQFERSYYAYLIFKDKFNNVVPSNTINMEIARNEFETNENRKYVLKQGCKILYDGTYGRVLTGKTDEEIEELVKNDKTNFIYTLPFTFIVNGDPLYVSYYLSLRNEAKYLEFTYINQESVVQFISTYITWVRSYVTDPDTYKLNVTFTQNITADQGALKLDENGELVENRMKVFMIIYNLDSDNSEVPYRYKEGDLIDFDYKRDYTLSYQFNFKTNDVISDKNEIRIENVNVPTTGDVSYGYCSPHIKAEIYVLIDKQEADPIKAGRGVLDNYIPGLEGYVLTNTYNVDSGLEFYTNYSDIVTSIVTTEDRIERGYDHFKGFIVKSVPVIRYTYADSEENMKYLIDEFNYKRAYIKKGMQLLENNFLIDFKMFNTYGPSRIYSIDSYGNRMIDRINMTFNFEIKLIYASDTYTKDNIIKDIKDILEDLNDMEDLHIPNLITSITNKYRLYIEYIEFLGFNECGPGVQHLYKNEYDDVSIVPEFITVHTNNDMTPDINIRLA